jgi:mono/diheme cytochrome c family protein
VVGFKLTMMRKHILFFMGVIAAIGFAACGNAASSSETTSANAKALSGEQVYNDNCVICHGVDGKAQMAGATDLSTSVLTPESASNVIANGRNGMRSFATQLTKDEIDAVVKHIESLRK